MALEEFLGDGDVLIRDHAPPGLVFRYRVDERRRVAVTQAVENFRESE
jgi:hypothetical protein